MVHVHVIVSLFAGVLLSIPDNMPKLHTGIARLCEFWWTHNLRGRETIAVNSITYYLEKSLLPKAPVSSLIQERQAFVDCVRY